EEETVLHVMMHFFAHASPLLLYSVVVVVLALESCGVPIANTTLLLFTGALASMGRVNIWALGLSALCGSVLGVCLAYVIGVYQGRSILQRVALWFHLNPQHIDIAERWFQRSGVWMVFASRIIPYIRPFSGFPAGITRTPFLRFFISATLGSLVWCSAILYVGWSLGKRWDQALTIIQAYTLPTVFALVLLLVLYCIITYRVKKILNNRLLVYVEEDENAKHVSDRDLLQI
ncbi:MAG TPA: DedA family protein, partial [Ktedonobacteraceae bacterium]